MIKALTDVGYTVTHEFGGPLSTEQIAADNETGLYYIGQGAVPEGIEAVDYPPSVNKHAVRVQGHGVNTTIYTHDEDSIRDLLSHVEEPHPRYIQE